MEEDYTFPEEIIEQLKLEPGFTVRKGDHKMDKTKRGYLIYLE